MDSHAYAPSEAVPLRRGRDNDVVMADADYDAKRRRTDAHTGDSAPARRVPQEDTDVYLSREQSYESSSPISGSAQSDSRTLICISHALSSCRLPILPAYQSTCYIIF